MKNNEFLDVNAYQTMVTNIEKFQKQERNAQENNNNYGNISIKETYSNFGDIGHENFIPAPPGCEECEKENTYGLALLSVSNQGVILPEKSQNIKSGVNVRHPFLNI